MNQLPEDSFGLDGMGAESIPDQGATTMTTDRPYHAKRPHKKSRAGCQNCKTRKVKCNEERPRCRACTLRREVCVYPTAAQTSAAPSTTPPRAARPPAAARAAIAVSTNTSTSLMPASSSSSSSSSDDGSTSHTRAYSRGGSPGMVSLTDDFTLVNWGSASTTTSRQPVGYVRGGAPILDNSFTLLDEPLFVPAAIDQIDMKLLWFYTAKGFDAFAAEAGHQPKVDEILQVAIPRHAFASRFLMDCLLALSALELQLLNQPIEPARVLMYRARAFAGYRKAVEEATPESYPALLACSLLLCALSSEMFRDAERTPLYILDWMVVWRGIGLIVKLIQPDMLFKSGMYMLFARPPINLDSSAKHIPNQMLFMVSSIRQDDPDFMYIDLYYETLKYLGSLYRELESGIGRILNLRTITWFTFLPKGFVDIARERRPRALIILAHYLVFVKLCNRLWWMQGIADKEIKDILNVLEDEWKSYVAGPIAALETTDEIAIGKILLNNNSWQPDFVYDPVKDNQIKGLTLVDNSGHNIVYNGSWVQADTGKSAVWNIQEALDTSVTAFKPDELIGLRRLSLQNAEGSSSAPETATGDDAFNANVIF
ncbi:hypothetical protein SEUCBS139899_000393 [Sporothrix eucalyptigena]|uniref:Zn(2)-C6 fungal-type domain-containing protein n=1 Tax=Sporothrix eucalyptigena TaxID=1812306 RepID=A0ABP0BD39_9PEZI